MILIDCLKNCFKKNIKSNFDYSKEYSVFFKKVLDYIPDIERIVLDSEKQQSKNSGLKVHLFIQKHEKNKFPLNNFKIKRIDMGENGKAIRFEDKQNFIYINQNFLGHLFCDIKGDLNQIKAFLSWINNDENVDFNGCDFSDKNVLNEICFHAAKVLILHEVMHVFRRHLECKHNKSKLNDRMYEIDADIHACIYVLNDLGNIKENLNGKLLFAVLGIISLFKFLSKQDIYLAEERILATSYPAPYQRLFIGICFALTRPSKYMSDTEKNNFENGLVEKVLFFYLNYFRYFEIDIENIREYKQKNKDVSQYPDFLDTLVKDNSSGADS